MRAFAPQDPKIRASLPVHERGDHESLVPRSLRIDGLVVKPLDLTLADLELMAQHELRDTLDVGKVGSSRTSDGAEFYCKRFSRVRGHIERLATFKQALEISASLCLRN